MICNKLGDVATFLKIQGGEVSELKNAVIKSASIFIGDHGMLTAYIHLDFGGSSQGFGGYVLEGGSRGFARSKNYCGHFIRRALDVVGVENWEDLKGKSVRVLSTHHKVRAIGNIIADEWFCPDVDFKGAN